MIPSRRTTPTGKEPAAQTEGCEELPTYTALNVGEPKNSSVPQR